MPRAGGHSRARPSAAPPPPQELPPAEALQLLERTAEGLRLRQRLGGLLRKLFTGEAAQRVKLSLPYRGCAIDVSILLGTVVTYS
jgi:hypothetical protein